MKNLSRLGRAFFAAAMAAFGLQYLIHALAASAPALGPPWIPAPHFSGYVSAIILVAAAAGIATATLARCSAISLAILLLVRPLLAYVPRLVANIHDPGPWTSGSELLALCGAALVLAGVKKLGRILFAARSWCSGSSIFCMPTSLQPWCRRGFRAACSGHILSEWPLLPQPFLSPLRKRRGCRQFCWDSCSFCGCSSCICPEWLRRHTTEMSGRVCLWRWPCLVERF